MDDDSMNLTLREVANNPKPLKRKDFNRMEVVNAFARSFELLGGVPRLVLWGNENYGEFIKLYAKLFPATSVQIGDNSRVIIQHSLPPTALDSHEGFTLEVLPSDARDLT